MERVHLVNKMTDIEFAKRHPEIIAGKPVQFWSTYESEIGKFIADHKIVPLSKQSRVDIVSEGMKGPIVTIGPSSTFWLFWHGGMKNLHVHYKDEVYLLNQEQWNELTKPIIKNIKEKIQAANTLSFENTLVLTDVVNNVTRRG
jgi:hypothetical protein